jgi:site-specific recombinase XerD
VHWRLHYLEIVMTVRPVPLDTVVSTSSASLLTEHVPAYRAYLVDRGYAASYVEHCEAVVARLDLWMTQACRRVGDLDETSIAEFLYQRVPRRRAAVAGRRPDDHHAPLVHLLVVLRTARAVPPKALDTTPVGEELRRFDHYLSHARGLARCTRENTLRIVGRILRERFAGDAIKFDAIAPEHVRSFLAEQAKVHTTPTSLSRVVSSLRGYFRWRSSQGDPIHALVGALSSPANWQQASLPTSLKPAEVDQLVASFGQAGASMRRADAMVRCALDLGLRIGEVARLSLDDIDWAAGTITLRRTKCRREHVMPLPVATGDAIVAYLRSERPKTLHRMVFASHKTPHERCLGRAAVGKIIREAYARAGLPHTRPHLLRHTMASRLLATGSSIKEVADVLRHRSLNATRIYAKLDSRHLVEVALPWPGAVAPSTTGSQA